MHGATNIKMWLAVNTYGLVLNPLIISQHLSFVSYIPEDGLTFGWNLYFYSVYIKKFQYTLCVCWYYYAM